MLKKISGSLTLRIFILLSVLIIAACVVTYGAIAYLTPLSYTSLLEDELRQESAALIERMQERSAADCEDLLTDFARKTGAYMRLTNAYGDVLYDTLPVREATDIAQMGAVPAHTDANAGTAQVALSQGNETQETSEGIVTAMREAGNCMAQEEETAWAYAEESSREGGEDADTSQRIERVTIIDDAIVIDAQGVYRFTFIDGQTAVLTVEGGRRAVNQATEAMGRLLPFLALMIPAFSLAGSFFCAWYIARPIVLMSGMAKRMATLHFCDRWTQKRGDEIGALGESLNLISDNLSEALDKLQTANKTLELDIQKEREMDRQRQAFFSAASHELKTPVTILKGQLSGMLARVGVYQDREKYLARALEVTGRMEVLIKEVLTISRIESGTFAPGTAPVNISELIQKQIDLDEELIEQKELRLHAHIEPNVMMAGDERLLVHAIDNVLMNAALYSPPGEDICVVLREGLFSVENTGVFIPRAALGRLFEAFYRVEQSRNRKSGGSGLGLYLVKSIFSLHGATCQIENSEKGVRFTARF